MVRIVYNPYEGVDWGSVDHHHSEIHDHVRQGGAIPFDYAYEIIDYKAGEAPDFDGHYIPDGDEYTIFAMPEGGNTMYWPWTELEDIEGGDAENRDPEEMGVVSFPAVEHEEGEHVTSFMSTATQEKLGTRGVYNYPESTARSYTRATDYHVPEEEGGLVALSHPERYVDDPEDEWGRWIRSFHWLAREDGFLGVETFGRRDPQVTAYDKLLEFFMPHRPLFCYGVTDQRGGATGEHLAINCTSILLDEDDFDPSDQEGTREAAARAFRDGRTVAHWREEWDPDEEDPAPWCEITNVEVDGLEITVESDEADKIVWISKGGKVHEGETIEVEDEHHPYVRAEAVTENDGEVTSRTLTNPFGIEGESDVARIGDANFGDLNMG